ncbi:MAG: restriction endonuclease subunit S, partial [Oscillospiraceae bacterium]|nr:restriction endonuclease subunit S [Oscillospiraceae bacterium]
MREMKDSGIVWIGEIPQNWKTTKLLNVLRCPISDGPHETPELVTENGIPFISVDSLNSTKSVDLSIVKKFISQELYEEYNKKTNLEKNDILFSKAATIGKTAIIGDEKFMVWSPLAIIKVNKDNCVDYIYYLLNSEELIKHISLMGSYNTQINVGMRNLERAPIPVPLLSEQQKIADFLDTQCSKVDTLIANQQSQIEKLKSYKQSLITEVVTKGLDKNVHMKDSGVEWIGEIASTFSV